MAKTGNARAAKKSGGVKVPGSVPGADWINGALNSPLAREALAAALVAGAAAAASVLGKSNTGAGRVMRAGATAVADEGRQAGDMARELTQAAVGTVVGLAANAAQSFLPSPKARRAATSPDSDSKPQARIASSEDRPQAGGAKRKSRPASTARKAGSPRKRKT